MAVAFDLAGCLQQPWADSIADPRREARSRADGDGRREGNSNSHLSPTSQSSYPLADAAPHAYAGSAAHAHPDPGWSPR